jgi:hypothetical protein
MKEESKMTKEEIRLKALELALLRSDFLYRDPTSYDIKSAILLAEYYARFAYGESGEILRKEMLSDKFLYDTDDD